MGNHKEIPRNPTLEHKLFRQRGATQESQGQITSLSMVYDNFRAFAIRADRRRLNAHRAQHTLTRKTQTS